MKTVYLTAGHEVVNGKGNGAVSQYGDEAVQALRIVGDLSAELRRMGIKIENDIPTDRLTRVLNWLTPRVTANDLVIDIHFNSAANEKANGTEVIIPDKYTQKELNLAIAVGRAISSTLGTRLRQGQLIHSGVKIEAETPRKRIGVLRQPWKGTNILVEVCFISNYDEMTTKYPLNYNRMIIAMADAIARHL